MIHPDPEIEAWRQRTLSYLKKAFGRSCYLQTKRDQPDPSRWTVLFHWYPQWYWRHLDLDFRAWLLSQPYVDNVYTAGTHSDVDLAHTSSDHPALYGWAIRYKDPDKIEAIEPMSDQGWGRDFPDTRLMSRSAKVPKFRAVLIDNSANPMRPYWACQHRHSSRAAAQSCANEARAQQRRAKDIAR